MPSVAKKIASSTVWQLSSQITMAALSILNVKFVAVALSMELAGYYNSAYGFLQLFGILADFGLYAVSVREMSRAKNREEVFGALLFLRLVILCLSLSSAIFIAWVIPSWNGTPLPTGIVVASLAPFFTLLAGTMRSVFQVHYRLHYVFIAEVSQRILTTIMLGMLVFLGFRGSTDVRLYLYALYTGSVGALVLLFISCWYARQYIRVSLWWSPVLVKKLLKSAIPFGVAYLLLAFCRQFDMTIISLLRPDFDIQNANLGFVSRMADMGFLIPTFLLNSTLPIVSERRERGEDASVLLGKTFLILLVLGTISLLFAALWPRPLISLLTTDRYLSTAAHPGADTALFLMSVPMFFNGLILFSFYIFLVRGAWKRLALTLSIGATFSLIGNFLLVPPLGFVGTSYTAIATHALLACLLLPQAFSTLPVRIPRQAFVRWSSFSVLLAGALWIIRPFLSSSIATILGLSGMTVLLCVFLWITGLLGLFLGTPHHLGTPPEI
ncbi:MAG: oligosaccharide flippase family protein [Candidatus Peribacteraceae bacterium]|nr:oligosaccharide flippase family protein [Candidatus Peribacteraceae bacterium]MDD5074969.1 oligosaccharide flippase family protein [Candidatus Peribacteraceae bacterium]